MPSAQTQTEKLYTPEEYLALERAAVSSSIGVEMRLSDLFAWVQFVSEGKEG